MQVDALRPADGSFHWRRGVAADWRPAAGAVLLALVYAAIYKLVLVFSSFGASVGSTFWPASGVTVSVLLLRPRREWPMYAAAIYVADFTMDITGAGFSHGVAIGIAAANCAEPLLAATLLRGRLGRAPDLSQLRELGLFYAAAAVAGPLLSATISSIWQALVGGAAVWPFLGRWYVGDALGVIIVAPLLLTHAGARWRPAISRSHALLLAAVLAGAAVTLPWRFAAGVGLPFMVIPAMSLIGIRFGTRGAALAAFAVGLIVEILTAAGVGAFAGGGTFTGLLSVQMYLVACSASGLIAAALMAGLIKRDQLALHDSLTGVANRRLLLDRFAMATSRLSRTPGAVGLVFVDLDGFKAVNDRYGHAIGDHVLVEVARRLRGLVRDEDTVARFGGDEFVILVQSDAGDDALAALATRVRQVVSDPIQHTSASIEIGVSLGWTTTVRSDEQPEAVLARADAAMYAAKRSLPSGVSAPGRTALEPGPQPGAITD